MALPLVAGGRGEQSGFVVREFLVSPNVEVVSVETRDLEFANSDHNPVRATLRRRED